MHGQNTFVDVATKPEGLLLFDSTLDHEVLSRDDAARAADDNWMHAPGRISVVFMENIQTHDYHTPEWTAANHDRLCREQAARGVVPKRKRKAVVLANGGRVWRCARKLGLQIEISVGHRRHGGVG